MKTTINQFGKAIYKVCCLAAVLFAFSCSPELEKDLESLDAKSNVNKSSKAILKEIVNGANIKGANGLDIGPDGNLYIGSVWGRNITVMDKQTGRILRRMGPEMGVDGPDDLVFGPDGSIYWTDIITGVVGRIAPDGTLTQQFVAPGVNPIGFLLKENEAPRLFVALDFLGDGLYELDPNLVEPPREIIIATPENPFPLGFLNAFDFDENGKMFAPLFAAGLVITVDVGNPGDPVSTSPFTDGTVQVLASGFKHPASAKFGPDGMLNVLDQTGEIFKINPETGEKTVATVLEPGLDNQVFDEDGTHYITNNDRGWVVEVLPSGKTRTLSPGGLVLPQGVAVLRGENGGDAVFVADHYNVRKFDGRTGRQTDLFKASLIPETDPISITPPMSISADGGYVIISSWVGQAVQVYNPQTRQVVENYAMDRPIDAVRFQNDILVTDIAIGGLVWASDHSIVIPIDGVSLFAPSGLATDGETVWMAGWGTGIIWEITFNGRTANPPVPIASGMVGPEGLALDNQGGLLVVEPGASRLSRIDLSTGDISTVVEGLSLSGPGLAFTPPTWLFDGVSVGPSGDIYLTGGGKNVVYKVKQ